MSDFRHLCRGIALGSILAAALALAAEGAAAGISPQAYVASELMQTSQSDALVADDGAARAEFAHRLDGPWQAVARQGHPLAGVTSSTRG